MSVPVRVGAQRVLSAVGVALLGVFALALALGVGYLAPTRPVYAVGVALVVLALGLTLVEPATLPVLCIPLVLVVVRVGGNGLDLFLSDLVLFAAAWPALAFSVRPFSPPMRAILWLLGVYLAVTSLAVLYHPYRANVLEWAHQASLVGGALLVGWTVGRRGLAHVAVWLLTLCGVVLACSVIIEAIRLSREGTLTAIYPQWPYPMHKNLAGTILAFVALLTYARPAWGRMPRVPGTLVFLLLGTALVLTQSRQAVVGLAVGLVVLVLRGRREHRRSRVIILAVVPVLVFIGTVVQDQLHSDNEHNSTLQRIAWLKDSIVVWQSSPWFGAGNRWWYDNRFAIAFQPPNAEVEVLTTSGVVGLAAFLALMVGSIVVLWRVAPRYGSLAVAVVVARFVQGQLDLFWVAVQVSLPFVIVGLCLGAAAYEQHVEEPATPAGTALAEPDVRRDRPPAVRA